MTTASDDGEASGAPGGESDAELGGTAGQAGGSELIELAACESAVEMPSSAESEMAAAASAASAAASSVIGEASEAFGGVPDAGSNGTGGRADAGELVRAAACKSSAEMPRWAERRVGKEWRAGWAPAH